MAAMTNIRRLELFLVSGGITAFVVRILAYAAIDFNDSIHIAQINGVSVRTILSDLDRYDHTVNHNLPIIASALFLLAAWYVFHYLIFPKWQERPFQWLDLAPVIIVCGLVISGIFILSNTIHVDFRHDRMGNIIGFKEIYRARKLFLLSDSVTALAWILLYEVFAQLYYQFYKKAVEEEQDYKLNYLVLGVIVALAFMLIASWRLSSYLFYDYSARKITAVIVFVVAVYLLQDYYLKEVHYVRPNKRPAARSIPFLIYFLAVLSAAALIWGVLSRFDVFIPMVVIFIPLALYGSSMSIAYLRKNQFIEKTALETQVSTQSAELSGLRSQINPHFLFNALNSLYAVALKENSEQTADGIQKLGDMMRFMLHENNYERITLQREIGYLHNYIDIQRMRLDESKDIEIHINIEEPEREIYIAPMLLNPFIENAFKHGISFQKKSWIYITLTMNATTLYFKVHNSLHMQNGLDPEGKNSGIGLENVTKRLQLIYPDRHTLQIQQSDQDFFISLTLTYC